MEREKTDGPGVRDRGGINYPYEFDEGIRRRARDFSSSSFRLSIASAALETLLLSTIAFSGAGETLALRLRHYPFYVRTPVFISIIVTVMFAAELPLAWAGFRQRRRFGIASMAPWKWLADQLRLYVLSIAVAAVASILIMLLIAISDLWWIYAAAAYVLFTLLYSRFFPLLAARFFYTFRELPEGPARDSVLELLRALGLENLSISVLNESTRSRRANAFVTGLGRAKRIVLFDNLIDAFAPEEVKCIAAHELGHYMAGDSFRSTVIQSAAAFLYAFIMFLSYSLSLSARLLYSRTDPLSLLIMSLAAGALSFLLSPLINYYSRLREIRADEFSLRMSENPEAFISSEKRLCDLNLMDENPSYWRRVFFATHPSTVERIEMGRRWLERGRTPDRD
jgi:STE24 endopeptidase